MTLADNPDWSPPVKMSVALRAACLRVLGRPRDARPLTRGEITIARLVFADAIDYSTVRVHDRGYLPFGLQSAHTAMAPNGQLYFPKACFRDDFSTDLASQMWFIHEMTHVWQHQLGYWVRLRGAVRIGLRYGYTLAPGRHLRDYNMEAQGNLIADYFALAHRGVEGRRHLYEHKYRSDPGALALFETVLADFIADPSNRRNLPRSALIRTT
ncbi:Rhs element Vgr protein [Caballeronia telluris]|uniref:Rhs element Vgr protein n=1 Tax=Caballeronia telluris TaxID=326475 RepID=A0A158FDN0_9BURK|nr:Rhs element Vgr protein [Caballeronia telluris]SAL17958.1 Rhs element Vgr protein [Caballeronia telluris]